MCIKHLLPSWDYFHTTFYDQLLPEQSPAHFPDLSLNPHVPPHACAHAAGRQTSCSVRGYSRRLRADRSSSGSQREAKKGEPTLRCWMWRNQQEVNRLAVFFQGQWKMREWKRECVFCPCFQERKVGQRRNRPGLWGQGWGGPWGRWWSSEV